MTLRRPNMGPLWTRLSGARLALAAFAAGAVLVVGFPSTNVFSSQPPQGCAQGGGGGAAGGAGGNAPGNRPLPGNGGPAVGSQGSNGIGNGSINRQSMPNNVPPAGGNPQVIQGNNQ